MIIKKFFVASRTEPVEESHAAPGPEPQFGHPWSAICDECSRESTSTKNFFTAPDDSSRLLIGGKTKVIKTAFKEIISQLCWGISRGIIGCCYRCDTCSVQLLRMDAIEDETIGLKKTFLAPFLDLVIL